MKWAFGLYATHMNKGQLPTSQPGVEAMKLFGALEGSPISSPVAPPYWLLNKFLALTIDGALARAALGWATTQRGALHCRPIPSLL